MKYKTIFGFSLMAVLSLSAADLRESTLVQVVNEVKVAPPQAAGRLLTVTLATLAPLKLLSTVSAELVQRGVLTRAVPSERDP